MYSCSSPSWITYAIDGVLFAAAMLTIYVMQKADKDQQINRIDSKWIRNGRRIAFIAVAFLACITILTDVSPLAILSLFSAATALLIVDAIALNQRPPQRGIRSVNRGPYVLAQKSHLRHALGFFLELFK